MSSLLALINQRKAAVSQIKTLKPNDGRNRYRILPSWRAVKDAPAGLDAQGAEMWSQQFWHDFGQHFLKDAAGKIKAVYVCSDKTHGRPCGICDELSRAVNQTGDDDQLKRIKDAQASGRVLLNVLHLDGPNPNEVQVLEIAPTVFNGKKGVGGIISLFQDWPNMLALSGSEGGADIIVEKSGKGLDTAYGVSAVPTNTTVTPAMLAKLTNLDKFVQQENDQGYQRALASVSAITGLLPAPAASLTKLAQEQFDDVPDVLSGTPVSTAAPVPAPTPVAAPVAAPAPAPVAPPAPVAAAVSPDADLEELLKDL